MILLTCITYLWNTVDSSPVQTVAPGLNIGNSGPSSKLVRQLIRPRICYHLCRRLTPQVNCWTRSRSGRWVANSCLKRKHTSPLSREQNFATTRACRHSSSGFKIRTFETENYEAEKERWEEVYPSKIHRRPSKKGKRRERERGTGWNFQNCRSLAWAETGLPNKLDRGEIRGR